MNTHPTTDTPERADLETLITAAEGDVITVSYESTHPNAGRITKTVEVLADPYRYDKPEDDHMAADVPVRDLERDDSPYALIYAHVDIPYDIDPDGIEELEDLFSTFSGYSDHHPAHTPGAVGRRLGTALRVENTEDDIVGCLGCGFGYPADEWSSCPVCSDDEDDHEVIPDGGMANTNTNTNTNTDGDDPNTPPLSPGDHVIDVESPKSPAREARVMDVTDTPANEELIDVLNATVAELNPEYPADDPIVRVKFVNPLDGRPEGTTYSYPRSRLQRLTDESEPAADPENDPEPPEVSN